jgi:alkanesulfonate monooxygenase SsuD/methylene tetrahydromethanopterin reductase-like flavin-dependent oxidoreductase (luciferase family)
VEGTVPFGIVDQTWEESSVGDEQVLDRITQVARAADEHGFRSFWVSEQHGARPTAPVYSRVSVPEIILAALTGRTHRITLGTGIKVLRTTNSFRAAEEMTCLDLVTAGRVEFGIGLGSSPTPMTPEQKSADFRDRFDQLLAILEGRSPDHPLVSPRPAADLVGRIWGAPRDPATQEFLAARGLNMVVGQAEVAPVQAAYVQRYRAAGGRRVRGVRLVHVAPTTAEARDEVRRAAEFYFDLMGGTGGYTGEAIARGYLPATIATLDDLLAATSIIAGSPKDVARQLDDYVATTGVDLLDVMVRIPYLPLEKVLSTVHLLADEVAPLLTAIR